MDIRLDEGFLFGMGAFETIAVEKGKPILLEKHLERLEQAADFFKLARAVNVDFQGKGCCRILQVRVLSSQIMVY